MIGLLLTLLLAEPAPAPVPPPLPDGYALHQSLPLDPAVNDTDGSVQILEDARITPALRGAMWRQTTDLDLILAPKDPLRAAIAKAPLRPAHLRLVDAAGKVVTDEAFTVPLADLDRQQLHAGPPTLLVTSDHSIGAGDYAGLETRLRTVDHGKLVEEALPGRTMLPSSLRNAWRIVDDTQPDGSSAGAIQVVACHPNWTNPAWAEHREFVVDLTTYRFADGAWHDQSKSAVGYWESSQDWPEDFP